MQPKLEGYAFALLGLVDTAALATTASELAALDRAILSQPELSGALTDTALTSVIRGQVVSTLLTGKVSDTTVRLVAYAATHSPAQDLPHAVSELSVGAMVQQERGTMELAGLGLMAARHRAEGFADAGLENVATSDFAQIEGELFAWARAIESTPELRRLLVDRDAPVGERVSVTSSLLSGKVHDATLRLAQYTVVAGRARDIVGTLDFLVDYVAKARDWRVARVHSARDLDATSEAALVTALAALTGKNVDLQVTADATLLGGVVVEVGDLYVDASTKGRLAALHDAVANGRVLESALND